MPPRPSSVWQGLLPLLGQRLVVVDAGSRHLKLLVVESVAGRRRLVHRQTIDVQEEGLLAGEELHQHLEALLPQVGPHTIALVLPQHRCVSQLLEVPTASRAEAKRLVEEEALKLSGLSESTMAFDYVRLKPFGRYEHPCLLTLCRNSEIEEVIRRFAPPVREPSSVTDSRRASGVTSTAQALFAASRCLSPRPRHAVLVDLGANNTVVGIMVQGQGVFATSFPVGGQQFTRALAELQGCRLDEAEVLKRSTNLFSGPEAVPGYDKVIERWYGELRQAVSEWIEDHPELGLSLATLPCYLGGGGAAAEGLFEFLNGLSSVRFSPWPPVVSDEADWPMHQYWVAYGAALQALGAAPATVSLLPRELRETRLHHLVWQRLQAANVLLLLVAFLLLGIGTWQKIMLHNRKSHLIATTETALQAAATMNGLARRLNTEYEAVRPILHHQRQSLETLETLAAVQQVRGTQSYWYVLFADPLSYFAGSTLPVAATNLTNFAVSLFPTNAAPARREFVAELCIPQEGDDLRRTLSQVVDSLKHNRLFAKVDALPPERKRNLVDSKVQITNRVFGVALELADQPNESLPTALLRGGVARPTRESKRPTPLLRPRPERPATGMIQTNR